MTIRDKAVQTLVQISEEQAFSNLQVNKIIKEENISKQDQKLFITLVYGTLQHLISIDFILQEFIKKNFNDLKPEIKWILRVAVFQILYLNKIPDYALVNEAVNQVKKVNKRLSGMVNGTLRNIIRNKDELLEKIKNYPDLEIRYSLPKWIIQKYKKVYRDNAKKILAHVNDNPDLFIRVKPENFEDVFEELWELGAQPQKDPDLETEAIIIKNPSVFKGGISNSKLYKKGLITVQDKGAILIGNALNPKEGEKVLDICAAPGGKTTHLAEKLNNKGKVDAFDLYPHRVKLINANSSRLKLKNVTTAVKDATEYDPELVNLYDKVLVDAPCSGLGIIRRKPDIRYNITPEKIKELTKIQKQILENAFQYLKPDGILIYSTCTVNPEENEKIVQSVQKKFGKEFEVKNQNQTSFLDNSDGFYYAVITKNQ